MKNKKVIVSTLALCVTLSLGDVFAQVSDFDLGSQRGEVQNVLKVPGKVIDHKGIVVNPTPQTMKVTENKWLNVSAGFSIKDYKGAFAADVDFLKTSKKGVKVSLDFGEKACSGKNVKACSGAYSLEINSKGVTIVGYDERGAFYGLQTLRQLCKSREGMLPFVSINDFPDLEYRGVVEGFYGTPWSHQVRMSLIDFYGKNKMNTYLYGPKDDPYHSCPDWRKPYPDKEAVNLKELIDACNRARVDFVWAIHPGQDIKWNEEDYNNIINKFNWMYNLGVRTFAIFFDDISGEGTRSDRQVDLLNRLTKDFVQAKGDVGSLIVCPTDYSRLWAGPGPNDQLATYGKTLDKSIKVFYTGDVVCSDLTNETMDWVNSRIQRPAYYWWNYPVTDYCRNIIMQGPVYGLSNDITANDASGVVSNPMEHGEASKLAIYSTADYTWNVKEYNPIDSWERALTELAGPQREAYRTFAIHSADTETGYRRDESWETKTFRMKDWNEADANALYAEFEKVEAAPAILRQCDNALLKKELEPWLIEFEKLGRRGKGVIELGCLFRNGLDGAFWNKYAEVSMTEEDRAAYEAHKCGTMKLQPFYENAMDDMSYAFLKKLMGEAPLCNRGISSFANSGSVQTKLMFDGDEKTFYTSGVQQVNGSWIGVDMGTAREVRSVKILQGRNSVDDVDYFDHCILECTVDGKTWTTLIDDIKQQYEIEWNGDAVKARYVRLRRLDSERTNYASVRTFEINPISVETIGFAIKGDNASASLLAFDNDVNTTFALDGKLNIGIKEGAKKYILLLKNSPTNFTVSQLDGAGKALNEQQACSRYVEVNLVAGAKELCLIGKAEIAEIIACM